MSRNHARLNLKMAMCARCGSDLEARLDGHVYCTSRICQHYRKSHPTMKNVNAGRETRP